MNPRWYKRFRTPPLDQSDYSNLLHHGLKLSMYWRGSLKDCMIYNMQVIQLSGG